MVIAEAPSNIDATSTDKGWLSVETNIILCTTFAALAMVFLVVTAVFVYKRGEV